MVLHVKIMTITKFRKRCLGLWARFPTIFTVLCQSFFHQKLGGLLMPNLLYFIFDVLCGGRMFFNELKRHAMSEWAEAPTRRRAKIPYVDMDSQRSCSLIQMNY